MKMKVSVTVCDTCETQGKATKRYKLTQEGRSATVDLCVDDAKGIEKLLGQHARSRRASFAAAVTTVEEIEASKKGK